jgi:predicted DNA-binding transcriptional regulator AlpA
MCAANRLILAAACRGSGSTQRTWTEQIMSNETTMSGADVPILLTVPEAAKVLGIGRTLAYELVRTDTWPTPVIRAGKLIKIPSRPLLDLIAGGSPSPALGH